MTASILDEIKKGIVLLDGGMGTELIARGFPQGACPESWNEDKPEVVKEIHTNYYNAGSDAVLTNTFGGSKIKLKSYDLAEKCYELNFAAATIANQVKPEGKYLAGSMGPTGKFLKPQGKYTEEEFEEAYAEQAKGLSDGKVDFLLIETQYDLREALAALRGARKASDLPVFLTMTFNKGPRGFFTMMGNSVDQCIEEFEKEGVPVVGTNCTLDSSDMVDLIKIMREKTSLPIIAQANAGKPALDDDGKVSYAQELEDYVSYIPQMVENGVNLIGGCCGTNPDFIRKMAEVLKKK